MIFLNQPPGKESEGFIDHYIYYKHYRPDHSKERVVPDGTVNLIFELDGKPRFIYDNQSLKKKERHTEAWISGMKKEYITISAHQDSEMLVARFKIGQAFPILKRPLDQIEDQVIQASEIFGDKILDVRHELMRISDGEKKIRVLEKWLASLRNVQLRIPASVEEAIESLKANPFLEEKSLKQIIKESRFSQKQFIHHFKIHVGTTPKKFQQTLRFSEVLKRIQNQAKVDWMEVLYKCGYFDQAHFIKDFTRYSGLNPSQYIKDFNEFLNFFPLDKDK